MGGNRTLSASTSGGTGTCTFQWQISTSGTGGPWSNISGATGSSYNTGPLTATRYYRCQRNCTGLGCNDPYSNVLTVTVVPDPTITISGGGTVCVGGNRTLSASASGGTGTCTFQWQRATSTSGPWTVVGTNSSIYNTGTLSSSFVYRCRRICDGSGCSDPYSNTQTVTVVADPSISISGGGTVCTGGNRTLTASTSGGVACSFQWQRATSASGPWTIVGSNSSTYNTGTLTSTFVYRCRRICTGGGCSDPYSNTQTVTVVVDPTITASGSATICSGGSRTLSASTSGGVSCSYQWQISTSVGGPFSNISGATGSTYNTGALTATRYYRVRRVCVGSGCSDPYSNVLTVNVVPDPSISISGGGPVCPGGNRTLTASSSNGFGCSYQWQRAPSSSGPWTVVGTNSSTYNTGGLPSTSYYRCRRVCSGSGCSDPYSNVVSVVVVPNPIVSINGPSSITLCRGGNYTFSAIGSGGISCGYRWQTSSSPSGPWTTVGSNSSTYNTGSLNSTHYYRVQRYCVGSGCSDPYSSVARVIVVPDPSISISGGGSICSGQNRTLTASTSGGTGSCSFQWQRATTTGGPWTNVGTNSNTYNTGALTSTFVYRCRRTCSGNGCNISLSNTQTVALSPGNADLSSLSASGIVLSPPFSPSVTSYTGTTCPGTSTTLSATAADPNAQGVAGTGTVNISSGLNTFNVIVTADCGNTKTYTLNITGQDNTPPSLTCPGNISQPNDRGTCDAVVTYTNPTPTDNCPGATVSCSPASGSVFPVGTTTVTCTATDVGGNSTPCTFTVTVNDTTDPVISCPSNISQSNDAGQCGAVVTYATPSATDNCTSSSIGSRAFSYSGNIVNWTVPAGVTTITMEAWGAEGGNNNSSNVRPGLGAYIKGDITVTPGQTLKILVGQQPATTNGNGGGGGTFVTTSTNAPLIIAGGGGGSAQTTDSPNKHGQAGTTGGTGAARGSTGGINGNGGNADGTSSFLSGSGGATVADRL